MGKKKIAFFYQNDDYGKEGLEGAQKYAKKGRIQLAAEVPVEVTDTDLKSHALKLKESGAEAVILWILPKHAAIILGQSKAVGFEPQWVASSTLSDSNLMYKITKGLWEGVVYANFLNIESPLAKKYLEAQKKFRAKRTIHGNFLSCRLRVRGTHGRRPKRAGKDLTPDTFVKAMETIRNWNDWLGYDCHFHSSRSSGDEINVYLEVWP